MSQNVHNIYCQHITVSNGEVRSGDERWGEQRFNLLSIKGCVDEGNGSGLYRTSMCPVLLAIIQHIKPALYVQFFFFFLYIGMRQ